MFILKKDKPEIEPKMLFIPEFKRILSRDRSQGKSKSNKEFAYVYFMADFQSEYNIYGIEKSKMIAIDIMGSEFYEPDGIILDAVKKYESLQMTHSMRYLKSVRQSTDYLIKYYDEQMKKSFDDKEFNPKNLQASLKGVEEVIEKLEKWEKKINGEENEMQIRGGGSVGVFEDADSASWLKKN